MSHQPKSWCSSDSVTGEIVFKPDRTSAQVPQLVAQRQYLQRRVAVEFQSGKGLTYQGNQPTDHATEDSGKCLGSPPFSDAMEFCQRQRSPPRAPQDHKLLFQSMFSASRAPAGNPAAPKEAPTPDFGHGAKEQRGSGKYGGGNGMAYAAARLSDLPNASARPEVTTISVQLIAPT